MYSPEYKLAMRLAIAKAMGYGALDSIPNYPENLNDMNNAENFLLSERDWDVY